jgi:hypothetical protein
MVFIRNTKGMGLIEILIATGLTTVLGYAIMTMLMTSTKGLTTTRTSMEAQDVFVAIKSFIAEAGNCKASFGGIGVDPVVGWVSSGSFSLKTTGGTSAFAIGSSFGIGNAVTIKGYRIKQLSPDFMAADHKAILYVQYSRKENSFVKDFERFAPLWITPTSGAITDCRSIMNDDQIWKRSVDDMTNIFYDGLAQSTAGLGTVAIGISNAKLPATVHIHRGGGDSILGITSSPGGSGKADILFCPNLAASAASITNCSVDTWTVSASTAGLKIKTMDAGTLAASFDFDGDTQSLFTIPKVDSGAASTTKGFQIYDKGILIANRLNPSEGSFETNKSCSALFGGSTTSSCNNAAGAFYTSEGFALGTAFGHHQGSPNGWVGGAPGILAGESVTGGSAGAFHISGKGMFVAENSTLNDVINCYNLFDQTIIEQPDSTACSRATGGFFGRAGFAVGTGTGGNGFIIGLPGMVGGKTTTGSVNNSFKVSGMGMMIAEGSELDSVESCYQSIIPGVTPIGNPCASATGGFFGKWGFAVGTGSAGSTGYIFGRPGAISGEHTTGGNTGAFSLSGRGVFIAANGSTLTALDSCYSALAGSPTASCTGAAGAFLGQYGMALGAAGGPYVVLNPNKLELYNGADYVKLDGAGTIVTSGEITANSDRSLKQNISSLSQKEFIDKIMELNPVSYELKSDEQHKTRFGFIAQEIQAIFPNLVSEDKKTGILSLNYMGFVAPIVSVLKELVSKLLDFEKKQSDLEAQIKIQNEKIKALENKIEHLLQSITPVRKGSTQ